MATLQDAIAYVQTLAAQVSGIRGAPAYPPEDISIFPFAVAYAGGGNWEFGAGAGWKRGLHSITLEIHVARQDLGRDATEAMLFSDAIPNILMKNPTLGGNISTFSNIRYTFGPLGWQSAKTFGFRFFIEGVKMESAIT